VNPIRDFNQKARPELSVGPAVTRDQAQDLLEAARDFVGRLEDYLAAWMEEEKGI